MGGPDSTSTDDLPSRKGALRLPVLKLDQDGDKRYHDADQRDSDPRQRKYDAPWLEFTDPMMTSSRSPNGAGQDCGKQTATCSARPVGGANQRLCRLSAGHGQVLAVPPAGAFDHAQLCDLYRSMCARFLAPQRVDSVNCQRAPESALYRARRRPQHVGVRFRHRRTGASLDGRARSRGQGRKPRDSGGGAERRALTLASTGARCWSDDAASTTTSCGRGNSRIPRILELANSQQSDLTVSQFPAGRLSRAAGLVVEGSLYRAPQHRWIALVPRGGASVLLGLEDEPHAVDRTSC